MSTIHASAIVDPAAKIGEGVEIGPFCIVGPQVELADGVVLKGHVVISGNTRIGAGTQVFPFAVIGAPPQTLKPIGDDTRIVIGENSMIREHATIHPGTVGGGGLTSVGNNCLLMVSSHVGHDCHVGNNVVMANNGTLGGHVTLGDFVYIGGLSAIHQNVRIGAHAMIGGMSGVEQDVIPYGSVMGNRAFLAGLNIIGLKRRGFSRDQIHGLRRAYRLLFADEGTLAERLADVAEEFGDSDVVMDVVAFMQADSARSFVLPRADRGGA
ncbi:acyl-ACP--UDP-N-acetylglucosamine O-acyltransferase [Zavarzinia aquatilis]|uniref:Acyl-[acyl-carrier-protein]--UDP-N-acetylglucosamine O-acyltransferase n=1 Tax=Zavarzinia aquatilis TaxID=2211142 RepID=A0A317EGE6_9PROT|nr:acyl-ACP--UDP-N-acetylglucosamine O-acyltransferase [Zavarzinia aquatilis]PWR25831.1 acyl-[acyl-carrier-protein]--UDP-N-acetylglucosamine O-acyltransferase [Zavarzinia aquatilis]